MALIDEALRPFASKLDSQRLRRLQTSLKAVISSEMLVALKDHCDSSDEDVIETVVWNARAVVEAALK